MPILPWRVQPARWACHLILSTAASTTMEDVAIAMGETPRWFQLYWPKDDELTASFLPRAEKPDTVRSS